MGYSRNDLGEIREDGQQLDNDGNPVKPGIDDTLKAELQTLINGPTVRHAPSERDAFFAAGGVLDAEPYKLEDSQQSGHAEDVKAQAKSSTPSTKSDKSK